MQTFFEILALISVFGGIIGLAIIVFLSDLTGVGL